MVPSKSWRAPFLGGLMFLAVGLMAAAGSAQLPQPAPAQGQLAWEERLEPVRQEIKRLVREESVPSLAVAVALDGGLIWEEGFGWADRERRVRATAHTPYSLASITKPITATAAMLLHERGNLELDAPIEKCLGGLRLQGLAGDTSGVTARRIMAHSAGLPRHYYFYHAGYPPPDAEQTIARHGMVVFPPGTHFEYSNIGYRLLDVAVAHCSGRAFDDFLRTELFLPLGMNRSALGLSPAWQDKAAVRYDGAQRPIPFYLSDHPGSGDVWASAHDLLRFAMLHLMTPLPDQKQILPAGPIRAMQNLSSPAGAAEDWGLGWHLTTDRGHRVVRHGGQQPGVDNELLLYPDAGLAVVVLSNRNDPKVRGIAQWIAETILAPRAAGADAGDGEGQQSPPSTELAGRWEGTLTTHAGTEPFMLWFQPDGDIHVRMGGRMASLVNAPGRSGDAITGWFYGMMTTEEALRHRHVLSMSLLPLGDELVGQVVAETTSLDPGVYALAGFARLRRAGDLQP